MRQRFINLNLGLSLLIVFSLYGCAVAVIGIGAAGAGAFAYLNGKLTKTYESEYHDTVRASGTALEKLRIPVSEIISDELKTEIKARRPDDTPVEIEVVRMDQDHSQVSVRTGSVGVWDKRVSEQIHGYIDQNLNRTIGDEKSLENLAMADVQSITGEGVKPEITEEDLVDNSIQGTAPGESEVNQNGPAQAETLTRFAKMTTDSVFIIFFKQNSNDLSEKAIKKLDQVFEILRKNTYTKVLLNGYSDSWGSGSYNQMISEIRANAVKSYLAGKGIAPSRIRAFGHGSQKFIASNKSAEGRQLNRRVEIELVNP
jgi:outer membrane protein OmpA-like peptidoglycan-associated protein